MYITAHNLREKAKELDKNKVYILRCDNYEDKNQYYLENGKVYLFEVFNFQYAKSQGTRRLKKNALYVPALIDSSKNRIFNISN